MQNCSSLCSRERQAAITLSFAFTIPHQRKYFGISILHIYIPEIKHLLNTTIQILLGTNSAFTDTHTTVEKLVIRNVRKSGHTSPDYFSEPVLLCFLTLSAAFLPTPFYNSMS